SLAATQVAGVHADSRIDVRLQPDATRGGDRAGGRIQERGDLRVARALEVLLVARRETQHETRGQTGVIAAEKVLGTQKDVSHAEAGGARGVSVHLREVGIEPAAIHVEAETAVDERERHAHVEIVPQTIGHRSDDLVCEEVDDEAMDDEHARDLASMIGRPLSLRWSRSFPSTVSSRTRS